MKKSMNGKGDKPRPMNITKTEFDIKFDKIFIKKNEQANRRKKYYNSINNK